MTVITERPVMASVRLETFNIGTPAPLILDYSRLDVGTLGAGGETPDAQWTDWTEHLVQITTGRGGRQDGLAIVNDTGVLTATLRGVNLGFPTPNFLPEQRIRLMHVSGLGIRRLLYSGRVLDVIAENSLDGRGNVIPVVQITAVDSYANHDETTRYGAIPPTGSETFAQRIARLTPTATAPIEQPTTPDSGPILGRTVYEASMADHLTLACNTAGMMWWVGADNVTRFARREYDVETAQTFIGLAVAGVEGQPPITGLHYTRPVSSAGSQSFFNRVRMHNHGATIDPDSGEWVADDTDLLTVNLGSVYGFRDAELETNFAGEPTGDVDAWMQPAQNFTPKATAIVWNAQENLDAVPGLEIGRSVYLPTDDTGRDPWPWNLIIGVSHTITPTRWMVGLTLIGVVQ